MDDKEMGGKVERDPGSAEMEAGRQPTVTESAPSKGGDTRSIPIVAGALVGAVVGIAVWGGVTAATGYQFDWLAVGVGVFVGACVRFSGKGVPANVRLVPPSLIAVGLFAGNLLMLCILAAQKSNMPFGRVLADLPLDGLQLLVDGFQPLDVLYYVVAFAAGHLLALVRRG